MANRQKILIVDNDVSIAEMISQALTKEYYDTAIETDGQKALAAFAARTPDLVILELVLPVLDGYQICREIRRNSRVPIIMLSKKAEVFDRVLGLELGADDYIGKPFDIKDLVARVRAVLRRTEPAYVRSDSDTRMPSRKIIKFPDLIINLSNYAFLFNGQSVEMPPKEMELLFFLASSPDQVFTREQLLNNIWGYDYAGDTRTVDVHIKRLREKLGGSPYWSIGTVWSVGYKFQLRGTK